MDTINIRCRGQCGATQPDDEAALRAGWNYLQITTGWRCGSCERALKAAGSIIGTDHQTADILPPASRGALPKETASTVLAVSVKG